MAGLPRETFRVLFLDGCNRLLADEVLNVGTVNKVGVHPREVVRRALEVNATAVILVHNHPSGDPKPSQYDHKVTRQVEQACALVDVVVQDHVIVGSSGFFSFAANALIGDRPLQTTSSRRRCRLAAKP
jgi:DNA repair protein RadC